LTKTAAMDPVCGENTALLRRSHASELRFSTHLTKKRKEKVNVTYRGAQMYLSTSNPISLNALCNTRKVRNLAITRNQGRNIIVRRIWKAEWKEYEGGGGQFLHVPFKNGEKCSSYRFRKYQHWPQGSSLASEV